ncbi:DUF4082 domain-containing protein [Paenibacillus sp. HJGM_3]|uniref:DUF4082 domain-containing protein n=1 Tax=Paenibacillus sp. HJGM_3 TaxID=3379816 RepID=UPI00385C3BBD
MKFRKRFTALVLVVVLLATMMLPLTATAATYTTYTEKDQIINSNFTSMQGFALANGYAYSVKVDGSDAQAVLYSTNMTSGASTLMTNGDDNTTVISGLGHANDMAATIIDGVTYLFVVTLKNSAGTVQLVKLKVVGNTYFKVGEFNIQDTVGALWAMSGVEVTGQTGSTINLLFKSGTQFRRASLGLNATSGTITVAANPDFTIDLGSYAGSTSQGLGYWSANDTIYAPFTQGSPTESAVLVYHNVSTASGTITADSNLLFTLAETGYIEIESVNVAPDGKLWFNTNRLGGYDNVGYFNGYTASGFDTMFAGKSATSNGSGSDVELGTIFQPTTSGYIAGVKVYGRSGESGVHKVRIWRNSDGAVVAGPFDFSFSGSNNWVTFYLPTPLEVTANALYTVSVSSGGDTSNVYASIPNDLASGGSSGSLTWPANAGVYTYTVGARPTLTFNSTNYLRDVIFYPASSNDENMFGVKADTGSGGNGGAYELGTVFTSSVAGDITGVRVFGVQGESGNHTIRIWRNSDNTVIGGPFTFKFTGNDSWVQYNLASPVSIAANTAYTVSVTTGTDSGKLYAAVTGDFNSAGSNANHLSWTANAGVFTTTLGTRPTGTFNGNNYLRDIVFEP